MEAMETVKMKSQESVARLLKQVQDQPQEVKTWGAAAGGAVVGALAVAGAANGILALLSTLAAPPVALTIGAIGGGVLTWNYVQQQVASKSHNTPQDNTPQASVAHTKAVQAATDEPMRMAPPLAEEPIVVTPTEVTEDEIAETEVVETEVVETEVAETEVAGIVIPALPSVPDLVVAAAVEATTAPAGDDLAAINGIGPIYASRFQAAGIQTFAQLAQLTPARVHEIIGTGRSEHMIDAEGWIAEAAQFVESRSGRHEG